ncbi:MAG: dephospho-CoA kinase [Chloroflexi bacterium]|nr:dephospho-CoA kinase [Chloroflexota bacterium]
MKHVIGLTGNIASGKSTVGAMLTEHGVYLIDADKVAHQLMLPGKATYHAVVEHFGADILAADDSIDRKRLGAIVFGDPSALSELEHLSHPAVLAEIGRQIEAGPSGWYCVEAIKLLEASLGCSCEAIWVVSCHPQQQLERLATRGLNERESLVRINAQPALRHKLSAAHVVIDNSGELAATARQVEYALACADQTAFGKPQPAVPHE